MTTTIKVIDSIMGAGKTSFAVQMMRERPLDKWLYITPFTSEIERIVKAVPGFVQPVPTKDPNDPDSTLKKLNHLKQLMAEGVSIASSHALFEDIDGDVLKLAEDQGYILVLDEVMDVLRQPPKFDPNSEQGRRWKDEEDDDADEDSPQKQKYRAWIEGLLRYNILVRPTTGDPCCKLEPGPETCFPEFAHLQRYAREGRLVMVQGSLLIWQFPTDCFSAFKAVYNLTYLFDGTYQRAYYDLHGLNFEKFSVVKGPDGRYSLTPHNPEHDRPIIERARELIRVYQGPMNRKGDKTGKGQPLSNSWWKDKKYRPAAGSLMQSTADWFRKTLDKKSDEVMWTVHKTVRDNLKLFPPGFRGPDDKKKKKRRKEDKPSPFVSMNTRATNAYRDRTAAAYLVNRFFNVPVEKFFKALNVPVSEDQFALSEMIQWIWRSAIRDGKPIDLFVPSSRMRGLLLDWFNGNIGNLREPVRSEAFDPTEELAEGQRPSSAAAA